MDDFLSTFTDEELEPQTTAVTTIANEDIITAATVVSSEGKSKKKKKDKANKSDKSAQSAEEGNEMSDATTTSDISNDSITTEDDLTSDSNSNDSMTSPTGGETVEQRVRRDKPPSRVRFAESTQPGFVSMALEKVGLVFGNNEVLIDASFSVSTGERVGLVGPNGSGKTTQLKILAGDITPTTGTVVKSSKNLRVSFLRQEFLDSLNPNNTLRDELLGSFIDEIEILNEITSCEEQLGKSVDDETLMNTILERLQVLQEKAVSKGAYSLNPKVEKIMDSMGFSKFDADSKVNTFSGGWKMRIGLAKILLQDPNIVLLDEPTNHLDLDSVFWLEDFLRKQTIPMVIVSHDREFLDRVCNKIVDTEEGYSVSYDGNYSKFLEQKRARLDSWRDKYEKQMRYVKEEEKIIKKARGDPSQVHVASQKEAALEKLKKSEDWVRPPPKDKKFRFRFPPAPRCGQSMIDIKKLGHGYNSSVNGILFQNVNLQVDRGDRIGLLGPNGVGKSTFLRIMIGREEPKQGYSEFCSNNVEVNYFEQSTADSLNLDKTVFETVQEFCPPGYSTTEIRGLLSQFMFKGDDADKKIVYLSGGEKARVSLCQMMLKPSNLLALDEPTNHLDIASKEVLEEALQHYDGTVVVISHDRYFMSQVAKKIFVFENSTVVDHNCDYHDFMNEREEIKTKVESRYVAGDDNYRITNAKDIIIPEIEKSKKNFGGSGVTCGNLGKGIKNYKRYSNQ